MLKDEIKELNDKRQIKLEAKWNRKIRIQNTIHSTKLYKAYQRHLERKQVRDNIKYEKGTQKIINNLPKRLKKFSKKYDCADIYLYEQSFLIHPYLYSNMANYYLDKRGKDIIQFLKDNNIKYHLHTHNGTVDSCYTIRVYFNQ